jgi:hypothetical protein
MGVGTQVGGGWVTFGRPALSVRPAAGQLIGGELSSRGGVVAYASWRVTSIAKGRAVTSTAKVDQAARVKARQRRLAMERDRAAQDARIEDAAAAVFAALASRVDAERAMAVADDRVAHGLRRLLEEGLTTHQAAQLCDLTAGAAQKLLRRHARTAPAAEQPGAHQVERDDRDCGHGAAGTDAGTPRATGGGNA